MFKRDELAGWLEEISEHLNKAVSIYMIGGGALSFKELKAVTKDIDLIVLSMSDFKAIDNAIQTAGYRRDTDLKDEFYLTALAVYKRGDSRIDVFLERVGKMLTLTPTMISRAEHFKKFNKLSVNLLANEDIFLFKAMAPREGDILDCDRLIRNDLNYNLVYEEIEEQSKGKHKWFFWLYEKLCAVEDFNGITTPLKEQVFQLVKSHWNEKPEDFMADVKNKEKHIPDKKLFRKIK